MKGPFTARLCFSVAKKYVSLNCVHLHCVSRMQISRNQTSERTETSDKQGVLTARNAHGTAVAEFMAKKLKQPRPQNATLNGQTNVNVDLLDLLNAQCRRSSRPRPSSSASHASPGKDVGISGEWIF
jgi:hypothetical protein